MRIRKRQVPLPLSSLLPVPLSDLYFNRSPAPTDGGGGGGGGGGGDDGCRGSAPLHQPPSDLSDRLIRRWGIDGCGFSDHGTRDEAEKNLNKEKALGDKNFEEEEEESDAVGSKNVVSGPETAVGNTSGESSSPSTQVFGRWSDHEAEKNVPLKKRRGISSEEDNSRATMSVNMEMKAKKCVGEIKKSEAVGGGDVGRSTVSKGRKKARGGALAEGSRCSRVNGRGWRCCQQTLVGYSLCEHHLGKGRLRSMSESAKNALGKNKEVRQSNLMMMMKNSEEEKTAESRCDQKITAAAGKKRVKLGMVKARSISSLLGQTSGTEIVAPADHCGRCDK